MAKTKTIKYRFYPLGTIEIKINNQDLIINADICLHGTRFTTVAQTFIEIDGQNFQRSKTFYFGEGKWLSLPNIEEAVLSHLNGTEEDVENVSKQYDKLVIFNMPEFLVKNLVKDFIKQEFDRLEFDKAGSDDF